MSSTRRGTDSFPAGTDVDTIQDLESSIAPMLLDVELRDVTLSRLGPEERRSANSALQHATRLHQVTEWSDQELLTRLGCTMTATDLQDVALPTLRRCEHFLGLVDRLVGYVDTRRDRRAVVLECAKRLRTTGRDSHGLQDDFETGTFPPVAYLRLGEISAAGDLVREHVGATRRVDNPYATVPTVHLSPPRLGMYLAGRRELLGAENVFDRIGSHIESCAACRRALEYRRASQQAGQAHR